MDSTPYYVLFVCHVEDVGHHHFLPVYGDTDILQVDDLEQEYKSNLYLTQVRQLDLGSITLQQTEEVAMETV